MKNNIRILGIMAIMLVLAGLPAMVAGLEDYADQAKISITMVNQEPDPVQPGYYADVRFSVQNIGLEQVSGLEVELIPKYPFSLDPGQESLTSIGTMNSLQKNANAVIIKYKVRVDENAIEGINKLSLRYRYDGGAWASRDFDVNIRTVDAQLAIESITTEPHVIAPGEEAKIQIRLKNMDDAILKDINVKLDLALSTIGAAANLDALPFAPLRSATEKKLQLLKPGEEALVTYDIVAYPSAADGVYKIPVELKYMDLQGTEYTKNEYIGVIVGDEPEMSVVLQANDITARATQGEIRIRFVNRGVSEIKFLNVRLQPSDYYTIMSPEEVYVGNIDSDDYEAADFDLYVKDNAPGTIELALHIQYKDGNNRAYDENIIVKMPIESDVPKATGGNNTAVIIGIVVAVIVIAGIVIWRVRKRRQD